MMNAMRARMKARKWTTDATSMTMRCGTKERTKATRAKTKATTTTTSPRVQLLLISVLSYAACWVPLDGISVMLYPWLLSEQ